MAAQDKKISSLSEWIYENIVNAANIVVAHAGTNYRIAMSTLKQYVLGDRNIGGIGSGDIVTTTDEQILTGKRIDEPSFNDSVKLSWDVTATQMNHLSGLSQNVQNALNSIGGDILTIENSIENLNGEVDALQDVLGDREIGGTDSGDIVTTDDAQTLTNKTLSSPKINSATSITATSEELNTLDGILSTTNELNKLHYITASTAEINKLHYMSATTDELNTLSGLTSTTIELNKLSGMTATTDELNKLHGVTASTAEINRLTGVTGSIQTQINSIISQLQGVTYRIYHYSPGVISGVTWQIINEATLRAEYGISTGYRVNPDSISVSVYKSDGNGRWILLPPAASSEGVVFFTTTTAGTASQTVLNSIDISLLSTESYRIVINYKVLELAGV